MKTFTRIALASAVLAAISSLSQAAAPDGRYVNGTFEVSEDETLTISANRAAVGAIKSNTSVTLDDGVTLTVQGTVDGPEDGRDGYAYGASTALGYTLDFSGDLDVDIKTTGDGLNAIGLYFQHGASLDGTLDITSRTDKNTDNNRHAHALFVGGGIASGQTIVLSGDLTKLTAAGSGILDAVSTYDTSNGSAAGNGTVINFNAAKTEIQTFAESGNTESYGIRNYRSTMNFTGNTSVVAQSADTTTKTFGIRLEAGPGDANKTLVKFAGNTTELKAFGSSGNTAAVFTSGAEGVNITSSVVNIVATNSGTVGPDQYTAGLYAQYGSTISISNENAKVDIEADGTGLTYGLRNTVYGGQGVGTFGSIAIAGDSTITVNSSGGNAVGVSNKTYPAYTTNPDDNDGVFLTGSTILDVTATGSGHVAMGVDASNEHSGGAKTVINDLTATITGNGGAVAYGIQGTHASSTTISGTSSITAVGGTSYGIVLEGSTLDVGGSLTATGETEGLMMNDTSTVRVTDGSSFATNTMQSSGQTNLGQSSTLAVAGETGGSSSLGNVAAGNATVDVGIGSFGISNFTGENKTVFYSDLSGNEGVTIGTNSGSTTYATDGSNNDQFASAMEAAQAMADTIDINVNEEGSEHEVSIAQGTVNNAILATYDPVTKQLTNIRETEHSALSALGSVTSLGIINLRHEMSSLTKRMGELRDSPAGVGAWVRLYGSENEVGSQNVTAKNATIQVGSDLSVGDWKVGAALSYTDGRATYDAGEGDSNTYGFALYGTWLAENGQFLDLIAKYSRVNQDFSIEGMNGSYDNNAFALSAEYGWRFELGPVAFIEPQAQFTYFRVMGDDFATSNDVKVEQDDYDSYIGRIGVRGGFKFPNNKGNLYARVSFLYDFDGEMHADVRSLTGRGHNTIDEDLGGSWVEYGIGANFNLTDRTYSYVDLERSSGGEVKENWRWNIGLRHVF